MRLTVYSMAIVLVVLVVLVHFCVYVVSRSISSCTVSVRWQFPLIAQVGVQVPAPIEAAITAVLCRK